VTDYPAMALKTSMRKISKYLPKSNELLARALELDEKADIGQDQGFELPPGAVIDVQTVPDASKGPVSPMDKLKDKLGVTPEQKPGKPPAKPGPLTDAELDAEIARESGS
jgi:recombinational DNA repair protein RecT